jgi:CBS domain containing-hemolysin-like protein
MTGSAAPPLGTGDLPLLLSLPVLLMISAFFSGSETAVFGLTGQHCARLGRQDTLFSRATMTLLSDPRMLLITLMLGNMIANVTYFVVSSVLLLKYNRTSHPAVLLAIATALPLVAIIIFGEILPKLVANTARLTWVRITAVPLLAIHEIIAPLRILLANWIITPLSRLFSPRRRPPSLTADELASLLAISQQRGVIDRSEEQLLREVVQLNQIKVRDVMVPRVDVRWIDRRATPAEVDRLIRETRIARFPICNGDLDHVEGVLYVRRYLLAGGAGGKPDLVKLTRPVRFVPELQRVDQLLIDMRRFHDHMVIAVDEFGGTAGIVTMKDVVERIVGDLDMDQAPGEGTVPEAELIEADVWRVDGGLSVHDWADAFNQPHLPARVATVGGLVMALLGHTPQPGDTARLGNLHFEVETVDGLRIQSVILHLNEAREEEVGIS